MNVKVVDIVHKNSHFSVTVSLYEIVAVDYSYDVKNFIGFFVCLPVQIILSTITVAAADYGVKIILDFSELVHTLSL